jgi:glycosyltransferase involved in cell wall biosynthesis
VALSPGFRLKIAHFYQEPRIRFSEPRAAQLHIYHTIRGLQQAGHQVTLVALQERRVLCTQDLEVFKSDRQLASDYAGLGLSGTVAFNLFESGVRRLQAELRFPYLALFDSNRMGEAGSKNLKGFDLIHERFNLLSLGGVWASRKLGIPLILEVNADLLEQRKFKGRPERGLRRLYAEWSTRVCFNAATKIICISAGLKNHLSSTWSIEASKLVVLPCAADVEALGPNLNSNHIRRSLGLATEPVVIWVGGFYPWHDLDLLLKSFTLVLQRRADAKLVLVGDGQTRPSVEEMVQRNGLRGAVILTGAIAHTRVPEMLSIADVAVVPAAPVSASHGGTGTPLKLFEYMAAGKAIVATAQDHAAEVIRDGHDGLLVAAGDVNRFAEAMLTLLNDPIERGRLGQNARQQAVERYSWEEYTRRLEEIYLNVLGNASSGPPRAKNS